MHIAEEYKLTNKNQGVPLACQCVGITIQVPSIVHKPNASAIVWWNPRIEWERKWERSIGC